jgi:hypothetical protein
MEPTGRRCPAPGLFRSDPAQYLMVVSEECRLSQDARCSSTDARNPNGWLPFGLGRPDGQQWTKDKLWWTWTGSNRRPLPCHLRKYNEIRESARKTKDLARSDLDAGGRHGRFFRLWTPRGLRRFTTKKGSFSRPPTQPKSVSSILRFRYFSRRLFFNLRSPSGIRMHGI